MTFGLQPLEHLKILDATFGDLKRDETSIRYVITCCILANHLPEVVFAHYAINDPAKLHGHVKKATYRKYIETVCPEAALVRDLCNYSKHGRFDRDSPYQSAGLVISHFVIVPLLRLGLRAGVQTRKAVKVVDQSGANSNVVPIIQAVVRFWRTEFENNSL